MSHKLLTTATSHEPQLQATGHKPLAALFRLPGRGRLVRPSSGAHAEREAEALPPPKRSKLERRGRFEPSPASKGPEAERGAFMIYNPQTTSYKSRATGYKLRAEASLKTNYVSPRRRNCAPRTTHHAQRTHRADTRVRPYGVTRAADHKLPDSGGPYAAHCPSWKVKLQT